MKVVKYYEGENSKDVSGVDKKKGRGKNILCYETTEKYNILLHMLVKNESVSSEDLHCPQWCV